MKEMPVVFLSEGQQVMGVWHEGRGRRPRPAVIFFHGFTGNCQEPHRIFVETARRLAAQGIGALRVDFRGSGNSEGSFADMTISSEITDAKASLRWLRRQPGVDVSRIGLVGLSMGGVVTSHMLAADKKIRTAVLWNPAMLPKALHDAWITPARRKELARSPVLDFGGSPVGKKFFQELEKNKPIAALAKAVCPVLIIQGTADQVCNPAGAEASRDALLKAGGEVRFVTVPGADHCFSSFAWSEAAQAATVDWFKLRLA